MTSIADCRPVGPATRAGAVVVVMAQRSGCSVLKNSRFRIAERSTGSGMVQKMKTRPSYAIASVDHALHIATMLQLEGRLTVSEAAQRLGIARSTAHRLLTMLIYRDFAVQDESRVYHAGPVLELAAHSPSEASRLRVI